MNAHLFCSLRPFVAGLALAGLTLSCAAETASPAGDAMESLPAAAHIGDSDVTLAELDAFIKDQLLEQQTGGDPAALHELRIQQIDNLIGKRLLDAEAERRGVTPDEVLEQEARARVSVTDAEVQKFFDENQGRMNSDYAELAPQIREYLERQAGAEAARTFVSELRKQAGVEVLLEAPRVDVATNGPALGPEDAPITIVEFSDYQCSFCRRAEPTVKQVLEQYGDQVRFVYKHYPLESIHPLARGASEAASCAEDQGRFWEYHELIFTSANGLEPPALDGYAKELELDLDVFHACMAEGRQTARVSRDLADGNRAGVKSTPTFFVNGIQIKGAQPFSEFQRIIESELAAATPTG